MLLMALSVGAKVWTPTSIPVAHTADRERYVCNPEGILSQQAVDRIDAMMRTVEDSTGIQALIAVVSDIEPDDCFEFAHLLGEKHGVGTSGSNNGFVLLLSTGERCVQFATGYGVEGFLPDALCRRIQEQYMNPYFRNDDWDNGMINGAIALKEAMINPESIISGSESEDDVLPPGTVIILMLMFFFMPLIFIITAWRAQHKCPECKQHTLKRISRTYVGKSGGYKIYSSLYECSNCHHKLTRTEKQYENTGGSNLGGGFGGGFTGGFSGGSGPIGGHYGGGHFGGGGAGSRF